MWIKLIDGNLSLINRWRVILFMKEKALVQTRDVVEYSLKYISGKTLDFGAGRAKYKKIIAKKADKYIAFDMFPGANIDVVGDILNSPFKENEFDTIVTNQVLEHIEKPWLMVKEIKRILKAGGICIATAPFINPYHPDPEDFFRYTKEGLRSLFKNENFEILEYGSYGKTFIVLNIFFQFLFFNPFKKPKRGSWKINGLLTKIASYLDRFVKSDIIYGCVYVIAKKR